MWNIVNPWKDLEQYLGRVTPATLYLIEENFKIQSGSFKVQILHLLLLKIDEFSRVFNKRLVFYLKDVLDCFRFPYEFLTI